MARRKRPEGTRTPNGASTIYFGKDQRWHGRVTVGVKDDGTPDRRHVNSKSESVVRNKVHELERERDDGKVRKTGQSWTVEQWLKHWLENVVAPRFLLRMPSMPTRSLAACTLFLEWVRTDCASSKWSTSKSCTGR